MSRKIQQPEIILTAAGIIYLLAALFTKTLYLKHVIKDTAYQISMIYIFMAFGLFFLGFGIIYHHTQYKLYSKWLSWVHIAITLSLSILISINSERITPDEPKYMDLSNWTSFEKYSITITITQIIVLFCLVQLLYFLNLLLAIVRK